MGNFGRVKGSMRVLIEDSTTPRSVREKLQDMIGYLDKEGDDDQRKIATALSDLDEMSADINLPPYVRTQLFSVSSELEAMGNCE